MDDQAYLRQALKEAEEEALNNNNYLGEAFDDDDDELGASTEADQISLRARLNRDILSSEVDFRGMKLKKGHESRPIWVCPTGSIYLETTSPFFKHATDFLVAVGEPESRPDFIHHYKLTPYSLYAAVSVNLTTETILQTLEKYSKVPVPDQVVKFIVKCTSSHGKAKLVLKKNRLFVESPFPEVLKKLLRVQAIKDSRETGIEARLELLNKKNVDNDGVFETQVEEEQEHAKAVKDSDIQKIDQFEKSFEKMLENIDDVNEEEDNEEEEPQVAPQESKRRKIESNDGVKSTTVVNFEVKPACIEQVKAAAMKMDYPLMEEYDFRSDSFNADLPMSLRSSTRVRPYQETCLAKMFGNRRARSGIIVLPCGAGKTLTGITAACTIKKSCIIFCINAVGVEQWIRSVKQFTTLPHEYLRRFTSGSKEDLHPAGATCLVTTYNMMSFSGTRSKESERVMQQVKNTEWGLIIMDEVHVAPARMFRMALLHVKSHCKLGLTATLVREDDLIGDLNFLIGPKLYEANWMDLTEQGYLAKVLCSEVWCPMTAEFFRQYLDPKVPSKTKQLLYVMNPNKYSICKMLLDYHEKKKDKVLIFSDNIPAIRRYSKMLGVRHMYGNTQEWEREGLLKRFRGEPGESEINALIISQVGDVGIDLPQANVIIQISSHFGSRRQEAQRLGRILRPKAGEEFNVGFNSFFYSLISMDTSEMYFSNKRQKYLVDQGYTFKVIRNIKEIALASGVEYEELDINEQRHIQANLDANDVDIYNPKAKSQKTVSHATSNTKKTTSISKFLKKR